MKTQYVGLGKKGSFNIKKGALHKMLGVPQGQKIPASKLKPKAGDSTLLRRRKASAKGLKAMHHGGARHEHHAGAGGRREAKGHDAIGSHPGYTMGMKKRK